MNELVDILRVPIILVLDNIPPIARVHVEVREYPFIELEVPDKKIRNLRDDRLEDFRLFTEFLQFFVDYLVNHVVIVVLFAREVVGELVFFYFYGFKDLDDVLFNLIFLLLNEPLLILKRETFQPFLHRELHRAILRFFFGSFCRSDFC